MTNEEAHTFLLQLHTDKQLNPSEHEALRVAIKVLKQEPNTWSLDDAREDFVDDVFNTLDFLPTNDEANQIIDSFDRVTRDIRLQPCEDCISREAALEQAMDYGSKTFLIPANSIKALPPVKPKYTDEEIDKAQAVEQAYIDKMVELTVEELKRPKGKWISRWYGDKNFHVCSECSEEFSCDMETGIGIDNYCYCPKCGAKLREEDS